LKTALASHPGIRLSACDIADEAAIAAFAEEVACETDHIDVLINCAGGFGVIGAIDKIASSDWIATFRDNLLGPFLAIKYFLPLLGRSQTPHIINFAGGGAFSPFPRYSAYACSKAALVRLTETLAAELLPQGVAVNAIAPGLLRTNVHEATLTAGPEQAGVQFRRTAHLMQKVNSQTDPRMETVQRCVRALISPTYRGLTGKTISANFDPWATEAFQENIIEITRSELYTMRRTNPVNLPDGPLRSILMAEWKKHLVRK
jgi:3-oxoacyl-[acyl-carrier protein] reductase